MAMMTSLRPPAAVPGDPHRLGAECDARGTNFAVFSSVGAYGGDVSLILVDDAGVETEVPLFAETDIWHGYVADVGAGQRYGFRVNGPYEPARGLFFDRNVLLLDPYAKAMEPARSGAARELVSLVIDRSFDWADDVAAPRSWADTVLYETHVKGISAAHPGVPVPLRGTYAGLAHPAVLDHLVGLGVTALELMPVQQFLSEPFLLDRQLTNYWGYSTIGFFAPHGAYSSSGFGGQQVREFKAMVAALHAAGLEVILDVVYNHTAEGGPGAPALSFRGLANDAYYRLDPADPSRYIDTTGTGNSLNSDRPEPLRLMLDSLRYWVTDMHVNGFRFDLAAALAREHGYVDRLSAFFDLLYQDPVLNRVKLIAEPWDVGAPDSYQVGRFPAGWAEWNDRYRDTIRDFWRGRGSVAELASRLTGSSDIYGFTRRGPDASVNFVVAHDGKTLADLVTYEQKYNLANGEGNADGTSDDRAASYGIEGPTDDPAITAVRRQQQRNLLATLLVSQGVAMLSGGDEFGRTQGGNNNAYCQDNATTWYEWTPSADTSALTAFVARAVRLQLTHPALRRRTFLTGEAPSGRLPDVTWYDHSGQPMTPERWQDPTSHFLALLLAGDMTDRLTPEGHPEHDDDILVLLNAATDPAELTVPGRTGARYTVTLDTLSPDGAPEPETATLQPADRYIVAPRTVIIATSPVPL
jgi:glycogen operon protein